LKRLLAGPLNGTALALYFLLLPYVVITKWDLARHARNGSELRFLLLVLALFWIIFLFQMVRNVSRVRRGLSTGIGGSAWLAGLLVTLLSFLFTPSSAPAHQGGLAASSRGAIPMSEHRNDHSAPLLWHKSAKGSRPKLPVPALSAVPLALMAKRRNDLIRQQQFTDIGQDVDQTIGLLRERRPDVIAHIRASINGRSGGVMDVSINMNGSELPSVDEPCVACYLGPSATGSWVGFAREGGRLPIPPTWSDDEIRGSVVALHDGKLVFAATSNELLRALATRSIRHTLVIYLGGASDLDTELAACCITVAPFASLDSLSAGASSSAGPAAAPPATSFPVRVNLLQADPTVIGLTEPFTPTLRRRSLEMLAYLALHRQEPVTGDRLRSRALTYANVDASIRTLANTASAVRRSVGADQSGPRLHAVTSSGLYVTHGIASDVEGFSNLIARARQLPNSDAAPLAHEALAMVKSEPLASALRGYEWFLAEGFGARLSRDGEWAALLVHHDALQHDRYEMAFWALQQGLLIDPYSGVLLEAIAKVPRLREFRSDRSNISKDHTVGAGGAVAMSWSLNGFRNQISK
jgi:hypothetical protein